jgi:hypothetical protein
MLKMFLILELNTYAFLYIGASVKSEEEEFIKVLESRAQAGDGKIKVVDINKKETEIEVKELITLSKVVEWVKEKFPGFIHQRIPVHLILII